MTNPFELLEARLSSIEAILIELKNNHQSPATPPQPFIKGIHELSRFLQVSPARAQKLKNEGAFPYWQDGRTLLFDPNKVREAMGKLNNRKR